MTTTFTWAINNLEHYVTDGIVYLVHYSVVADDGTCTNSIYNSTRLEQPEGDIIPYTDLTPEVVIGWLQDKLDVPAIEASLQAQLDEQATPTKAVGLPWSNDVVSDSVSNDVVSDSVSNDVSDSVILPPSEMTYDRNPEFGADAYFANEAAQAPINEQEPNQ